MINDSIRSYTDVMNGEELAKQLLSEVHRSAEIKTSDNDTHVKLEDIKKILESIDRNLTKELHELTNTVESNARATKRGPGSGGSSTAKTKLPSNIGTLATVMAKTHLAITDLNKTMLNGITVLSRAMRIANRSNASTVADAATGGSGGGTIPGGSGANRNVKKMNLALAGTNMVLNQGISMFNSSLNTMGINYMNVFDGVLKQGPQHVQDMRVLLFTTQGAGVAMTNLEKSHIELNNVAAETGKTWGEAATLYRKEMKKGLTTEIIAGKIHTRTSTDAMRLTKNSMRTANMIGASAENTAELFSEWNRHLGMTNEQLGFVGREMEQVAKNSGVTGDELLAATKAASVLVKQIRDFAGISQQGMSQIIQTQTSLEKFGAVDIGAKFNQAMSEGIRSLSQAEPAIASIIAESAQRAGKDITGSMLTSGEDQREMQRAIMQTLEGRLSRVGGMAGINPEQLLSRLQSMRDSGQNTGRIEQQIKNVTGLGAGQLQSYYKSLKESSMSFNQRMKVFGDRMEQSATPEGKALAARQRNDFIKLDQRQQLSTFSDMLSETGDINVALARYNGRMKKEGRLDAMLGKGGEKALVARGIGGLAERAKEAGLDLNAILKKRGMTQEGLQSGMLDPKVASDMHAIFQEAENEIMSQLKANQDPMLKANKALAEINEALTKSVTRLYMAFVSFELIMGTAVALLAAKAGTGLMSISNLTSLFGKGKGGKLLAGGNAVAGRAAGAVTAAGNAAAFRVGGTAASRAAAGLGGKALASGGAKLAGAGLNAALGVSTGGISVLVTALLGGFIGAMDAAANATTIFNKKQEDLTYTNVVAAKTAGFLTGTLDFITFGIFDKWIGPTGTWTKSIAEFFDNFWPLAVLFDISIKPLEIIWGLLKGIWGFMEEAFSGMWEGIKSAWEPLKGVFQDVKNIFNELLGPGGEAVDVVKLISDSFRWLGKQLGEMFKSHGKIIGDFIKKTLPAIKTFVGFIVKQLVPVFENTYKWIKGIYEVVSGLLTFDSKKIASGVQSIFTSIAGAVKGLMFELPKWLVTKLPMLLYKGFMWLNTDLPGLVSNAFITGMDALWEWVKEKIGASSGHSARKLGAVASPVGALAADILELDIGSKNITSNGLAYLHKGEIVVPQKYSQQMRGESEGPFNANAVGLGLFSKDQGKEAMGGGISEMIEELFTPVQGSAVDKISQALGFGSIGRPKNKSSSESKISIEDYLQSMVENGNNTNRLLANMMNTGLFDRTSIGDAVYESALQSEKRFDNMFASESTNPIIIEAQEVLLGKAGAFNSGLFAKDQISEAMNVLNSEIIQKQESENTLRNPIDTLMNLLGFGSSKSTVSAGNSLYYNKEAEYQQATTQTGASGGTTNNYVNQGRRVRGLPIKGGINTNMLNSSGDVEEYILQSQLLNQPSGGNSGGMAMPILERIAEAVESGRLDEIILLLTAIRDKNNNVLINAGGGSGGVPSVEGSGLREGYNKSWLNGDWTHLGDPSFSDNANILGTSRG